MTSQNVLVSASATDRQQSSRGLRPRSEVSDEVAGLDEVMAGARVVAGIIAASLAQTDARVTLPQLRVLAVTADRGALTVNDVADVLGVHASNATRLVDRLVDRGWVERRTDPQNGRQRRLTLTQSGRSLLASVMDHRRAALRQLMEGLPAAARAELVSAMGALAAQSRVETDIASWVVPTGPQRI